MSAEADFTGTETATDAVPEQVAEADFTGTETSTDAVPEQAAEADSPEVTETGMSAEKVNLTTVAKDLYQTGLDLGLTPAEAALLVSEMALPCTYQR